MVGEMTMHQKFDDDDDDEGDGGGAAAERRRLEARWHQLRLRYQAGSLTDCPKCPRCRGVLQPLNLTWLCVNDACGYRRRDRDKAS